MTILVSPLEKELIDLNFSRNANMAQLVIDWPRLQKVIYINNESVGQLLSRSGIDLNELDH
jgi:hypothetical protein